MLVPTNCKNVLQDISEVFIRHIRSPSVNLQRTDAVRDCDFKESLSQKQKITQFHVSA